MPRRNRNAKRGRRRHPKGSGGGWMHGKAGRGKGDRAPLTPGSMHSKTRVR